MGDARGRLTQSRKDAKTRVKICGLKDVATALAAVESGADTIGLNFIEESARRVAPEAARDIAAALPPYVTAVGLFCDHPAAFIRDTAQAAGLTTVQLHGQESPALLDELEGLRVIKAFGFDPDRFAEQIQPWRDAPSNLVAFLLDTPPAAGATTTGGSGHAFDWDALARLQGEGLFAGLPPTYLAGGLTPQTVAQAVRTVRPHAVDVASGVESSRGVKDPAMIAAFCDAVRAADAAPH